MGETHYRSGVIEGFYGRCWSLSQRLQMIDDLARAGLNTFMIAPKFDLHHRVNWRDPYPENGLEMFRSVCARARDRSIQIILSLSPGLSFTQSDAELLRDRFTDLASTGATALALLMDDIPYSRAAAEEHIRLLDHLMRHVHSEYPIAWYFCPTAYSGWHLSHWPDAVDYLKTLGKLLPEECAYFWTGNTIISKTISPSDLRWVTDTVGKPPVIWDNFPADDYVPGGTFFPGPLTGRDPSIPEHTEGFLVNPSEVFTASRVSVKTLGYWIADPTGYLPERAFDNALHEIAPNPESYHVLRDLAGYFYTAFDISDDWHRRLDRIKRYFDSPSGADSPLPELESVRARLRSDGNIRLLKDIWVECYPFVRSLLGDLDYLVGMCRRIEKGESGPALLPLRDARWSSPVNDLIHRLRTL